MRLVNRPAAGPTVEATRSPVDTDCGALRCRRANAKTNTAAMAAAHRPATPLKAAAPIGASDRPTARHAGSAGGQAAGCSGLAGTARLGIDQPSCPGDAFTNPFSRKAAPGQDRRRSRVDRGLTDLPSPDVVGEDRRAEFDMVVRRDGQAGVHHQIRRRPQVLGDRLPAAGLALGPPLALTRGRVVQDTRRRCPRRCSTGSRCCRTNIRCRRRTSP